MFVSHIWFILIHFDPFCISCFCFSRFFGCKGIARGAWGACRPPFVRLLIFKMANIRYLGGKKAQIWRIFNTLAPEITVGKLTLLKLILFHIKVFSTWQCGEYPGCDTLWPLTLWKILGWLSWLTAANKYFVVDLSRGCVLLKSAISTMQ